MVCCCRVGEGSVGLEWTHVPSAVAPDEREPNPP